MLQNHINGSSTGIEPAASSAASSSNWSDNLSEYSSRFAQSYNGMAVAAAASRADPASYFGSAGMISCNKITTTWIQIPPKTWNGFFSQTLAIGSWSNEIQ